MHPPATSSAILTDEVIKSMCPVLFLHPADNSMPVPVEWFIERSELVYFNDCVKGSAELTDLEQRDIRKLLPFGQVTQHRLLGTLQTDRSYS